GGFLAAVVFCAAPLGPLPANFRGPGSDGASRKRALATDLGCRRLIAPVSSAWRSILPVPVFGSAGRNCTSRGYLYGTSLCLTWFCSARFTAWASPTGSFVTTNAFSLIRLSC